jgi:hypothetical protein
MNAMLRTFLALGALAVARSALATPDAVASREIDHLLAFVAASDCRFVRSGTEAPGPEARDHLVRKLGVARPLISTADQFIDYVGTGSSMTGQPYKVRCGSRELTSREWLRAELERHRSATKAK